MLVRQAKPDELAAIYLMGFDVWGEDLSHHDYLIECHSSDKYALGSWYVLLVDSVPVASLIVYAAQFGLAPQCYGIGSVATASEHRGKGYASQLVQSVTHALLEEKNAEAVFLHADISLGFYARLGYQCLQNTACMGRFKASVSHPADYLGALPTYF